MTCSEVREYVFAFLDSELDAPLSIELQRHLDRCHECARETEIERAVARGLERTVQRDVTVPTFEVNALARMIEGDVVRRPPAWLSRRWFLPASIAAVIALVPTVYLTLLRTGAGGDSRFADLLVADFTHFLEEGSNVQVASGRRDTVSDWLSDKTQIGVTLPNPDTRHCRLVGGRKCKIDGKPAAFAIYDVDGSPASLVVVRGDEGTLDGMRRAEHAGRAYWSDHCKEHTIVAARHDGLVYAAVSTLPEEQLLCLITDRSNEGD